MHPAKIRCIKLAVNQKIAPLDPRSVANAILTIANENSIGVTQLSIQKIVYFMHGKSLIERGEPLVSGSFEAWPYGPVHPLLYETFKHYGANPISDHARSKDLMTGTVQTIDAPKDDEIRLLIRESALTYLRMTPGRLIDLSHAPRSPWDAATKCDEGGRKYGVRISNSDIRNLFKFHKVSIGAIPRVGEPNEESQPS